MVGTGTSGSVAARTSLLRAARLISDQAGIALTLRNFAVINTVHAVSIGARLDCDAFAAAHSATARYDKLSFVGLAWRPVGESCTAETYSTGKVNVPGALVSRDVLLSLEVMLPELYRHSTLPHLRNLFSDEAQQAHEKDFHIEGGGNAEPAPAPTPFGGEIDDDGELDLSELGL